MRYLPFEAEIGSNAQSHTKAAVFANTMPLWLEGSEGVCVLSRSIVHGDGQLLIILANCSSKQEYDPVLKISFSIR